MSIQDHARWVQLTDGVITVDITFAEALSYSQDYEAIGGFSTFRTLDGTGVKQQNWAKISTTVSGNGVIPAGLGGLDYTSPLTLKCGAPRSIASNSNVIVIPAGRRTDAPYLPYAYKFIDGVPYLAEVSFSGNTGTVVLDGQAARYAVLYFPEILVIINQPSESFAIDEASAGWSLTAEEV